MVELSDQSMNSRWVREELDAGMFRKIEKQTKLIAVRLDVVPYLRRYRAEEK